MKKPPRRLGLGGGFSVPRSPGGQRLWLTANANVEGGAGMASVWPAFQSRFSRASLGEGEVPQPTKLGYTIPLNCKQSVTFVLETDNNIRKRTHEKD